MSKDTSWETVHEWYDQAVGKEGHYYHQNIIIPKLLNLLTSAKSVLDIGCGQGVFARKLPKKMDYAGVDISPSLIAKAKSLTPWRKGNFFVQNAEKPIEIKALPFSHSVVILALQNMENPKAVLKNIHQALEEHGTLILILNHPCFRIPRMSGWHIDPKKKLQSRRVDVYMSSMEIPIQAHPSQGDQSNQSVSFHHPLSYYSKILSETGFCIELLEEWCSDKTSTGKAAKMENRARKEFPLFLAIVAKKL
jgi:SAM-dependent methyltransferase